MLSFFDKRGRLFWATIGFILVIVVGIADYLTGVELSITLFYLIPIFLVVWYTTERLGLVISAACAITWFLTEYSNGVIYSHFTVYVWNTLIRLGFFIVSSRLLSELKKALKVNQESAQVDYVTGAASVRYFYERLQVEIYRYQRSKRPFTLVYIDLDNFKAVNDLLGHITGDKVLRVVTGSIQRHIRPTDVLARMGGDEFAILLPETGGEEIKQVIGRIHSGLVKEMLSNRWLITFSIGVVTYIQIPKTLDEMVKLADGEMYMIKTGGKNGVHYRTYSG
jgi:diguanylate cyclase (GGDEF)-like protein